MISPLRILYLEDDPKDAELVHAILEGEGIACHITRVETEHEFSTSLELGGFDLVLADYRLPSFDGISALKIAQEVRPGMPFIFVSGTLGEEVAIETFKLGATDYVLKTRLSRISSSVRRALQEAEEKSQRKRAEEALRRSEAYLAEAQELTHTGSWALDPVNNEMLHCSGELLRIYGFDPEKGPQPGEAFLERVHQEDRDRVRELSSGAPEKKHRTNFRLVLPDGTIKYLHSILNPVFDDAGQVVEVVGTAIDVTEQKRAEEELRAAETRFRTYVDHATDALFVRDEQGRVIDMNRRACESLGYTREELMGTTPRFIDRGMEEIFFQQLPQRLEAGELVALESTHQRKDGSMFPVEVRIRPFCRSGHRFSLSLARDISERKRAEEESKKLQQMQADLEHINRVTTLGELSASLSHELKQPIAAAVSNAEACLYWLVREEPDLHEMREAATEMIKEARRAADIINRLRSFYKRDAAPVRELVDVNEVLREMLGLLRGEASQSCISMRTDLTAELPKVMADRVQLQQVFMNLMLNGIEAMKDTGGELTIKSEPGQDDYLLISVRDTGVGLPTERADEIFSAFFTTKPQGSGMGLSISRSIIESHGGRLWATATSGPGAVFYFTLPTRAIRFD